MNLLISISQARYRVLSTIEQREYNRVMQQRHREREKQLSELYQESNVSGISFTEFKRQIELSTWQKISIHLSDDELKITRLSFKLSDEQLRLVFNKRKELA